MPEPIKNYDTELQFAKNLAVQARKIALQYYKTNLEFITKSDSSPVTIADETINQLVIDAVRQQYPEHGVLGEEQSWQLDKKMLWVCDPIDGTIAFSMGEPTFMFSIALVDDGKPVTAVTADLVSGDIFWASIGRGAFLNAQPIQVSERQLSQAWLAFPTNLKILTDARGAYLRAAERVYQTNIIHGAVFKGMLIAQGLCDGSFWPASVHPWDAAAVKLIVEEAGGKFTDATNHEQRFDGEMPGGMVISNGIIHDELLAIIKASS